LIVALNGCSQADNPATKDGGNRLTQAPLPADFAGLDPEAVEMIRGAAENLNRAPHRPELWSQLGMVFHAYRRFELARTCYEERLSRDEEDAQTWYFLALIEDQLGETDLAVAHTERSIRIEPAYPPSHWRLGFLRLARGELDQAGAAMQAALAIAPQDAAAVVGMARVHLQKARSPEAVALLKEHLERIPRDDNARFLLGTAYRKMGRMEDAARALASGAGGEPAREDPWLGQVFALRAGYRKEFLFAVDALDKGHLDQAIALLEKLHEREPNDTLIHINLHRAYRKNGEPDRAIDLLVEARRIEPLQDMIHLHLAGAYRDKARQAGEPPDPGLLGTALESIRKACELSPTFANAHGLRGDVLLDLGLEKQAADAFLQAAGFDRTSVMWHEKAGRALCRSARWAEAIGVLRQLDILQPASAPTLFLLSAALANSGHLDEALAPLERARQLAPEDPAILKALYDIEKRRRRETEGEG
jgi:tetratricopeptide (TPR) repeat protein